MAKSIRKKVIAATVTSLLLLVTVLCVHIYLVTRPKAPDAHTIVMARVDFKQDISQADADKITSWVYHQPGIDHVLCNAGTDILIFTFYPVKTSGDEVVSNLKSALGYRNAVRFMPSEEELKNGCPVSSHSLTYKAYSFIRNIF